MTSWTAARRKPEARRQLPIVPLAALLLLVVVILATATPVGRITLAGQVFNFAAGCLVFGGWWVWRGVVQRARWPLSGLEWVFAAAGVVAALSVAASPDPRVSAGRFSELALLVVLLYFTLDCLRTGLDRHILTRGLLLATGVLLVLVLDETYLHYAALWEQTHSLRGTFALPIYRVVGLLGNVNYLAGVFNLTLPLAIWEWRTTPGRWGRGLVLFWELCFLLTLPFLESRGGLLGLLAMAGLLAGAWLWQRGDASLSGALGLFRRRWRWWMLCGVALLGILAAWLLYLNTRNDLIGSRINIWQAALAIIRGHPWLGIGLGRYGFESPGYLSDPQTFWPIHAHDVALTTMAECGLLGLPVFLWGIGTVLWEGWRGWRSAGPQRLYWGLATAALIGFIVHNLFDDLTQNAAVAVCLVVMLALLLADRLEQRGRWALAWVGVPLALLLVANAQWVWGNAAFEAARAAWSARDKAAALADIREAIRRDPLVFYSTEAGMLAADMAVDPVPPAAWSTSAADFSLALKGGEALPLLHANLGLADWWAGNTVQGLSEMETAARAAPGAASLNLTAGWMAEQQNRPDEAQTFYLAALRDQPGWQTHPFWQRTALRAQCLAASQRESTFVPDASTAAAQADDALASHNLAEISRLLNADANQIDPRVVDVMRGDVALAEGREGDGMLAYAQALAELTRPSVAQAGGTFWNGYGGGLYGRRILELPAVPGMLTLYATEAMEQRFELLAAWTRQHGGATASRRVAQSLLWLDPDNQSARALLAAP
jgi:O-antigen ligase